MCKINTCNGEAQALPEEPCGSGEIVLKVTVEPPEVCPVCREGRLHRHGFLKERKIRHAFFNGRWVFLAWIPVRYKCYRCGKTYTLRPPGISPWARFTRLGVQTVLYHAQRMSLNYAAQDFKNLTPCRVMRLVDKYIKPRLSWNDTEKEVVLTLDELSFSGNDFVCVVGRLEPDRKPLAILKDDRKATIKGYLEELKRAGVAVEAVVIDMKDSWRKLIKAVFPSAKIVVDPFHVIQDANRRLNEARKIEQEGSRENIPRLPLPRPRRTSLPDNKKSSKRSKGNTHPSMSCTS